MKNIPTKIRKVCLILQSLIQSAVNVLAVSQTMEINMFVFVALGVLSTVLHVVSVYSDKLVEEYEKITAHLNEIKDASSNGGITSRSIIVNTPNNEPTDVEEEIPLYAVLRNGQITFVEREVDAS